MKKILAAVILATLTTGAQATDQFEGNTNTGKSAVLADQTKAKNSTLSASTAVKLGRICANLVDAMIEVDATRSGFDLVMVMTNSGQGQLAGVDGQIAGVECAYKSPTHPQQTLFAVVAGQNKSWMLIEHPDSSIFTPALETFFQKQVEWEFGADAEQFGGTWVIWVIKEGKTTAPTSNPIKSSFEANFKALDNFLTGHQ